MFDKSPDPEDQDPEGQNKETAELSAELDMTESGAGAGRIDKVLAALFPDLSRARIQALIAQGRVFIDGAAVTTPSSPAPVSGHVRIQLPPPVASTPEPEDIPLSIIHEDADLIVIDKPAGLNVHPGAGQSGGTLVNALLHHCGDTLSGIGGVLRPGIVHRLDKDTSGIMLVAKNDAAHKALSHQLQERELSRHYTAFVWGHPAPPAGRIETWIGRDPRNRFKMTVLPEESSGARYAATNYHVQEVYASGRAAQLECRLETGRTHQIRVHMRHIHHPIISDPLYGKVTEPEPVRFLKRQALHAHELQFRHPGTDARVTLSAPLPPELIRLQNELLNL